MYCGIWKKVKKLTGEITVFDNLVIKTPAGFFAARGTAFTIGISENSETTLAIKQGEVEFIPAGRLSALTFTKGDKITFAAHTGNALRKSSDNKDYADGFMEWTRDVANRRIPSIMPSIVCREVIEIQQGGCVYCFSRPAAKAGLSVKKTTPAPESAKAQETATATMIPAEKQTSEITPPKQVTLVCDVKADYKGIYWNITGATLTTAFRSRQASEGKMFMAIDLTAENKSAARVFVFYDEEIKLKTANGDETISPDNYWMNTDHEPGAKSKGIILFLVAAGQQSFMLLFGKKSDEPVEAALYIQG